MKIKRNHFITLIIFMCLSVSTWAQRKQITALDALNTACIKAGKANKPVLLIFSASWNSWSPFIDSMLNQNGCKQIINKYYTSVYLRAKEQGDLKKLEKPGATELFTQYFFQDKAKIAYENNMPTVFILDKKKNKLAQYTGFPEDIGDFEQQLKHTSAITDQEIQVIDQNFKRIYGKVGALPSAEVLSNALAQAKNEHKKVFLIFHASWCHWCHELDTAMNNPACKKFFEDNFVICHLVAHEDSRYLLRQNLGSEEMLAKYQGDRSGIPFWVIFDADGKQLADFNGFPAPMYSEYNDFEDILRKTTDVTPDQLATIKSVFTGIMQKGAKKAIQ